MDDFDELAFDTAGGKEPYDFIFAFMHLHDDMAGGVEEAAGENLIAGGGFLYLAYPKEGSASGMEESDFYKDAAFEKIDFFEMKRYFVVGLQRLGD